ncbi:MAG: tRNA preQ1(34) S-adenosylmethionine ribosyltransferase-isomerase QueA [Deltaproteobacteria bacterium]|nr:tRNA preQ1(34) S-adenosylmethionine ribosyltransferase-isomerase QueA [Deltaproteobacteria bacterium]
MAGVPRESAASDPLAAFDYALDPARIAQHPAAERDGARLLVLDRASGALAHRTVRDLPELLSPGDLLVVNATRVLPARLRGRAASGGVREALLLGELPHAPDTDRRFRALVRGRVRPGSKLVFERRDERLEAEVAARGVEGEVELRFAPGAQPYALGETPLPPYIRREAPEPGDAERYQTVFARVPGSVAAPTAGLHLGEGLLGALARRGIELAEVVLHVGEGTFRPLRAADLETGLLHAEAFELTQSAADAVVRARGRGGRVVAVGTTTARVLESCAAQAGSVEARRGETRLFLRPGSRFRVVDALLTNFHLPRSSLLLLVAAFAGRERVLTTYAAAQAAGYRFYSFGDAMLVL